MESFDAFTLNLERKYLKLSHNNKKIEFLEFTVKLFTSMKGNCTTKIQKFANISKKIKVLQKHNKKIKEVHKEEIKILVTTYLIILNLLEKS
jgi:hypothetical protein